VNFVRICNIQFLFGRNYSLIQTLTIIISELVYQVVNQPYQAGIWLILPVFPLVGTEVGMPRRELRLGPGECSNVETGARFFAALAFPGSDEETARTNAEVAWAAQFLHDANRIDGSSAPFADPRLNELVNADQGWCRAALRTSRRRLGDRMTTARFVRPWISNWLEHPQPLPTGMKKFSQRQIAQYLSGGDQEKADNFQKRVLRPSRPVIHLAVAIDLHDAEAGCVKLDCGINLTDVDWFSRLVLLSNALKIHICATADFYLREQDLLHFVWVE
jgi:hypothetical protein